TIVLIVLLSSRISPRTSTVIFLERSPFATAVVTSAMFRTWPVRFAAIEFTLSVRSFHTPATPGTCAWPPSFPSEPTSRATRAAQRHAVVELPFLADQFRDARDFGSLGFLELDDVVEGLRDLAVDAGEIERHARREIAALELAQRFEQLSAVEHHLQACVDRFHRTPYGEFCVAKSVMLRGKIDRGYR